MTEEFSNRFVIRKLILRYIGMNQRFFLPLNCLKSFILIGSVLTIAVGMLSTFMVMYAFLMSSMWFQFSRILRNVLVLCFLLGSNLIVLTGVAGLYGVLRKKNLLLSIYSISILVYVVLFIVLGLFATLYPKQVLQSCQSSNSMRIQETFNQANQTLCKTCQCYFNNYDDYNESQQEILIHTLLQNSSETDTSLPVNASSCPQWNSNSSLTSQLYLMESFFSCSGWCPADPKYNLLFYFTNVNNGIPIDFCFNSLTNFFKKFGLMLQLSSFMVSGVLTIVIITLICLCYHPQRDKSRDSSFQPNLLADEQ